LVLFDTLSRSLFAGFSVMRMRFGLKLQDQLRWLAGSFFALTVAQAL
jgi:hypothetical protein